VVRRLEIEPLEYQLLTRILQGDTIGQVIEAVTLSADIELSELATSLQAWFQKWTEAHFFSDVTCREIGAS
jgi:hypothetical protein